MLLHDALDVRPIPKSPQESGSDFLLLTPMNPTNEQESPVYVKHTIIPSAHHINFGCSHPPRKIIPKYLVGIRSMNFPEFPGSVFVLALLQLSLIGNREFPRNFQRFPGEGF